MEEDTKPDMKPDIRLFFLEEKPNIKNLQQYPKEDNENILYSNRHLKSDVSGENLDGSGIFASMVKERKFDGIEHIKCEASDESSACLGGSQSQMHNEHLGGFEHKETELDTQTLNCTISELKTQTSGSLEDVETEVDAKTFGSITNLKSETKTQFLFRSTDVKSEVDTQNFYIKEHVKSEANVMKSDNNVHLKSQGQVKRVDGIDSCESEGNSCNINYNYPQFKSQGRVESFGGTEHLKPELSDESFDDVTDEKPCIAALRASVAAYSVNHKEALLESFPNTEMSSQEMPEPHCRVASNAQETDQESVNNCRSDARTSEQKQMEIEKRAEHSGKGKSSGCPETLTESSQDAEQKKTTTNEVSQSQQEILHQETCTGGLFQCFWCPYIYIQTVDRERHMKRFHREEYGKLLQEKNSQPVKAFHRSNGLQPCRMSSLWQSGKLLQTAHRRPSEIRCQARSERTVIETETPVDLDKLPQNKLARGNVAFSDMSKQVHKRFCSMQKSEDDKEFSKVTNVTVNNAPSFISQVQNVDLKMGTSNSYTCGCCGTICGSAGQLSIHKRTCTSQQPYKGHVCDKGFAHKSNLSIHKQTCTGEIPYKCDVCDKGFEYRSSLSKHMRSHTGETPYKCDVCGKGFGHSSSKSRHKRVHTGETPYKCDVCDKGFKYSSSLYMHMRSHTGEKPYKCDVCGKGFKYSSKLSTHKRAHTGETPYKCDVCGKGFGYSSKLSEHMRSHTGETPYKCDICGKGFGYSSSLSVHMRTHTGETPYKCDICGKGFTRSSGLSVHMRTHTGETPYKCDICGKGFTRSSGLSVHMRTHTGETPYKCDMCGKGFGYISSLSLHMRTHTGETPYKCDVCDKGFKYRSSLSIHMRSHTGETPYKCDVCGKEFGYSISLSKHKRIHTGETPYKCDVCDKGFKYSTSLSRHMRYHTAETPYVRGSDNITNLQQTPAATSEAQTISSTYNRPLQHRQRLR